MNTTNKDRYVRIVLLTFDSGKWISKKIIFREINRTPESPSLDALLGTRKHLLKQQHLQGYITRKQFELLFPKSGADTHVDDWDLLLLVKVILWLFPHSLSDSEKSDLNAILQIRNDLICHTHNTAINESEFLAYLARLTEIIPRLSFSFDDEAKHNSMDMITKCIKMPFDIQSAVEKLTELCRNDEQMDNVVSALVRMEHDTIQTASGVDAANKKLDDILSRVKTLLDPSHVSEDCRHIPILRSRVCIRGNDKVVTLAEEILLKVLQSSIRKADDITDDQSLKNAVKLCLDEIEKTDTVAVSADLGSIILKIKCLTLNALEHMLTMFRTNRNLWRFPCLEKALGDMFQEKFEVELVLPEEELEIISIWIGDCLNDTSNLPIGDRAYNKTLTMGFQCDSAEAVERAFNYFKSEDFATRCSDVSLALSDAVKDNVSVEFQLDTKGFSEDLNSLCEKETFKQEQASIGAKKIDVEMKLSEKPVHLGSNDNHDNTKVLVQHHKDKKDETMAQLIKASREECFTLKESVDDLTNKSDKHEAHVLFESNLHNNIEEAKSLNMDSDQQTAIHSYTEGDVQNRKRKKGMGEEIQAKYAKKNADQRFVWESALKKNDNITINQLLEKNVLPQQEHVELSIQCCSKTTVKDICRKVCKTIQTVSDKIISVEACYKAENPLQVVFVAMADESIDLNTDYCVRVCHPDGYSNEGTSITYNDERRRNKLSLKESKETAATIKEHSNELFKKHSNLQMINSCSVKSQGFGTNNSRIIRQTCIVLYVNVKGLIPLNEEPFPDHLTIPSTRSSFSVDVREGGMRFLSKSENKNKNLQLGCEITDLTNVGTAGPFYEKDGKTYCLTCAHVLSAHTSFNNVMLVAGIYVKKGYSPEHPAYEVPVYDTSRSKIGVVTEAVIASGSTMNTNAGIDLAVIELTDEKRLPQNGYFPDGNMELAGFTTDKPMVYTTGKVYDQTSFQKQTELSTEVVKYGSSSGYTRGEFDVEGTSIRRTSSSGQIKKLGCDLQNQLTVISVGDPLKNFFAENGDSGALVFAKHDNKWFDLRAVGIIEGETSNRETIVTPIWDIFKYLNRSTKLGLKSFDVPKLPIHDQEADASSSRAASETKKAIQQKPDVREIKDLLNHKLEEIKQTMEQQMDKQLNSLQELQNQNANRIETVVEKTVEKLMSVSGNTKKV